MKSAPFTRTQIEAYAKDGGYPDELIGPSQGALAALLSEVAKREKAESELAELRRKPTGGI